jgi:hypothetical protein
MNEDLSKELDVVLKLATEQAAYIEKLQSLICELWYGIKHARDSLDEMEAAIVGLKLKPLLEECVGKEAVFTYAVIHPEG